MTILPYEQALVNNYSTSPNVLTALFHLQKPFVFGFLAQITFNVTVQGVGRINASIFQIFPREKEVSAVNCFQAIESGENKHGEDLQNISDIS